MQSSQPNSPMEEKKVQHPLLEMKDVSRVFPVASGVFSSPQALVAVHDVSLHLEKGECLGLVGESGCGKSTLGRLACGLDMPTQGQILFHGEPVPQAGPASPLAGRIQMVFQDPFSSLDPRMRIADSIAEGLTTDAGRKRNLAAGKHTVHETVEGLLKAVGLAGAGRRYPHEFSGGQRQRIAIARAMATQPELVVCDEPVSALDASVQAQVLNLMRDMQDQFGLSMLFITHNLAVVGFMCPRILVMYLGEIVEEIPSADLGCGGAHPYTQALFAAMPDRTRIGCAPEAVHGELPSPLSPPSGCRFRTRCPKAQAVCAEERPEWKRMGSGWRVRCHFA